MSSSPRGHIATRSALRGAAAPGYVLRGEDERVRPARMTSDLSTNTLARLGVADPRVVDPHMEAIVQEACEAAREAGYADGHAAGFDDGRREGLELLAAQKAALLEQDAQERGARQERLSELLGALEMAVAAALDYQAPRVEEMRDLIAGMAVDIAEELVGHHLEVRDCAAKDAVLRALECIPRKVKVTLRLNPADLALVTQFTDGITDWELTRLVPDPAIARGDATADADNLEVEASIAGGFERIREVLHP